MRRERDWVRQAGIMGASLALIGAVTVVFRLLPVNTATTGFGYLIAVLAIASVWGLYQAVVASVVAMVLYNFYFLPPSGTLTIADPENWIALFSFLVTSTVASQLSERAKRQAAKAIGKQRELERLYHLGRRILLNSGGSGTPRQLAFAIADAFELPAVSLYDLTTKQEYKGGPEEIALPPAILTAASVSTDISMRSDDLGCRYALIRLGGLTVGVLGLKGTLSDTAVDAIANLVAIGLERARTQVAETRAEAARQSQELKSTMLDAIAHEFKTPLTSIKAAVTTLTAKPAPSEHDRELLSIIDEEADRLNGLVSDALKTSRMDGRDFQLQLAEVLPHQLWSIVLRQMGSRLRSRSVQITAAPSLDAVSMDRALVELALRQLLDNAVKYSPASSPIRVGVERRGDQVVFWVEDEGPGVPFEDVENIFSRFYRAQRHRLQIPGSGLGLSVVRQIATAHGGDALLSNHSAQGARFELILPLVLKPAQ